MGELANAARGSTPDRDLAMLALDVSGWSVEKAQEIGADTQAAMTSLATMTIPAKVVEPGGRLDGKRGPRTDRLVKALAKIGAKIAPTMAEQQMQVWIAAMTEALSDLPFAFSQKGAEAAIHTPMQFLNEVEKAVREKAEEARAQHSLAMRRLEVFQRQIERANEPKLPPPEREELTQERINTMPLHLRKLGLTLGHITQEQFDAAEASKDEGEA